MSLYGGIKFNIGDGQQPGAAPPGSNAVKQSTEVESHHHRVEDQAQSTFTASESKPKSPAQPFKPAVKASAALKFAPRIRQPRPAAGPSTTYSAEPVFIDTLRPEPPTSASSSTAKGKSHEVVFGNDGKALAKAPAMTLAASGGKRERGKEEEQRRKLKKKQRRRQQQQQLMSDFKPDEQYDPNRPNDLGEYQYYRKKLREEKRARLLEEKKRREQDGSGGESSYYSDSEDEAPRRDAPKMWAPPTSIYGAVSQSKPQAPPPPTSARPSSPPPASTQGSGDDAYARRVALSQAPTGDDAYARRQAMSTRPPTSEMNAPSQSNIVSASSHATWTQPATGDEAFARRAALSQGFNQIPPHPMPTFAPASAPVMPPFPPSQASAPLSTMPPFPPSAQPALSTETANLPSLAPPGHDIPGFGARPAAPVPSNSIDQGPAPGGGMSGDDFARMLEERKKAAASIAERLRNLGPPPAPPAPIPEPDDGTSSFAEKMMRRWGHKEGTGLGADGSGIKHALTAEHVSKPVDPKQPLSKRQIAKQKAAAANAKNKKWVVHGTNRGKIVNANEEEKRNEEQGKYGEASRIICLVGLVGGEDDIDEELSEEIGEECSKYGIVERVVQHLVEPAPVDPAECLRVFIVFTGMAGAWRTVKELDGRFFGGRKLRATYFDENRFNAGDRDGPIL